jgi:RNA polymerase sigma-70 factor, ECF subfamily
VSDIEAVVLKRAQQGDEESFVIVVETYQKPVYNLCYRMLGDPQEAEDAAQETFWRAHQAIQRYDINRSFITWLLSIAAHHCIDRQRKRRLPTYEMDAQPEIDIADHTPDPENVVSEMEDKEFMQQALSSLNPQDRAVLVMKYWYDLSEKEIATALSLSTSAVKSRLFRARKEVAQAYTTAPVKAFNTGGRQHESPAVR